VKPVKSQAPSTKPGPRPEGGDSEGEITNKSQIPIFNDQNKKQVWSAAGGLVIVICLIFVILNFYSSSTSIQLAIFPGKAIELWPGLKDRVFDVAYAA
jgi:hypothetical protein